MLNIAEIRQRFPEDTKGKSDAEVIFMVSKVTGLDPVQVARDFGVKDPENAPRGFFGAANDTAINFSNSVAGGIGAIANVISPGNRVSGAIDDFVQSGQEKLSLQERLSQDRFGRALDTDNIADQGRGVWERVKDAPLQTASQALGNLVTPGIAIKLAQRGAQALGIGGRAADKAVDAARNVGPITPQTGIAVGTKAADKAIERVGIGAGMVVSGAMNAGDAAGEAYDLVLESTGDEELATKAARQASVAPAIVGTLAGAVGAERLLARQGGSLQKGASILKTAGVEAASEFVEEGTAAYSGRKVASLYDDSINPMTGVFGQATMGAVQGGIMGGSVALFSPSGGRGEQQALADAINQDTTVDGTPLTSTMSIEDQAKHLSSILEQEKQQKDARLAQANQDANAQQAQAQQAQAQQAQAEQQAQIAQQLFDQFGIRPVLDQESNQPTGQYVLGNKQFFTENDAVAFAKKMMEVGKDLSPLQQTAIGKMFSEGVIPSKSTDTAKALVNRAKNFMDNNQLSSATTMDEMVSRIDAIIENVGPKADLISGKVSPEAKMLGDLDKLRKAVTGEASTRLGEIADQQLMGLKQKEAEKAAKKTGNKPQTAAAVVQPQGDTDGQQQQNTPGLGAVSVQSPAGTGDAGQFGPSGPTVVQPEQSGSVVEGQNGQQNDIGGVPLNGQRTDAANVANAPSVDFGQTLAPQAVNYGDTNTGAINGQQTQAGRIDGQIPGTGPVGEGQPGGAATTQQPSVDDNATAGRGRETAPEGQEGQTAEVDQAAKLLRTVLEYVFITKGGGKGKATARDKVDFFEQYLGVPAALRDETASRFAKERDLNVNTVKGWAKDLAEKDDGTSTFAQKYGERMREALELQAKERGVTFEQMVAELRASALTKLTGDAIEKAKEFESGQTGMARGVLREVTEQANAATADQQVNQLMSIEDDGSREGGDDRGSGITISDSPNATSLAEQGNFAEGISNKYIKLEEARQAAVKSGNQAAIDAATKRLEQFIKDMPQLEAKARRVADNLMKGRDRDSEVDTDALIEEAINEAFEGKPKQKTEPKKKAESKPKPEVIENTREAAGKQWDKVAATMDGAPKWKDLTKDQQDNFFEFGPKNWTENDVTLEMAKLQRSGIQESKTAKPVEGAYKASDLRKEVIDYIGVDNSKKLVVLQSAKDIPAHIVKTSRSVLKAQGFVYGGRAYLIADNIEAGRAKAVFLHEVGAHLGLQQMLDTEFDTLVDQINAWGKAADGSLESQVAQRALDRVANADTPVAQMETELVAYFIEEAVLAGVEPSQQGPIGKVFKKVLDLFKNALNRLGFDPHFLSAQDVVDMAYGAAQLELSGKLDEGSPRPDMPAQLSTAGNIKPAQIRRIDRNLQRLPKTMRPLMRHVAKAANRAQNHLRFTGHLLEQAARTMPGAKKFLDLIRQQNAMRNTERFNVEKITKAFSALNKPDQKTVNKLIKDSTSTNKWAFEPSWGSKSKVKVDPELKARFDQLPAEAQKVIRDVFAHGYVTMMRMRQEVNGQIRETYDEQIAEARKHGDEKLVKQLELDKAVQLKDYQRLFDISGTNPYAPLRRFGNHVVTYRSPEMLAAMDIIKRSRTEHVPDDALKTAREFVRKHEGDPKHYQVHFREGGVDAERLAEQLADQFGDGVQQFTRDEAAENLYTSPDIHGALMRLRKKASDTALSSDATEQSVRALNRLLGDLHISLLSEQSARHSEHRRAEGTVTGADENMMRAFHSHGLATSSILASLHKGKEVQSALEQFEREAKDHRNANREEAETLYNETAARYAVGLDTGPSPITDNLLRFSSVWMLLSRPIYYLQNSTQPWMLSAPYMAGRHHGKAFSTLLSTYKELGATMAGNRMNADVLGKLAPDARRVVGELLDRGELTISLDQEMGDRLRGASSVGKAVTWLQGLAERVEGINRVTTAVAAYRLEIAAGKSHQQAREYAAEVVYHTHGDYSGFNAPRVMRNQVGRIVTQFRKFQLIQLGLLARLGRDSFLRSDLTADEKAVARRALTYTLGTSFAMGGMYAMPGAFAIAWLIGKIFGEPDEPNDPEAQEARLRKMIGDPDMADLLTRGASKRFFGFDGAPLGLGGFGSTLSLIPFTKVEGTDRRTYSDIVLGMSGALVGGLGPKMFDSIGKFADGDIAGGLAQSLPGGLANVVKALDLAEKGVTRSAGAQILSPDDISEFTLILQALGLRSNELADKQFINRVTTTYDNYYRSETQRVKKQYSEAMSKGDSYGMQQARERWEELNESRRRNGFDTQPWSALFRSPKQAQKYERRINRQLDRTGRPLAGMR